MDEAAAMEEYGNALILAVINRRRDLFAAAKQAKYGQGSGARDQSAVNGSGKR